MIVIPLPGNGVLADRLAAELHADRGQATLRHFPDGETHVQVHTPVAGESVVLACTLARPDEKLLPLLLLAATVRDLGASSVGLVAPYLCYLRQDRRFEPGEGITSAYFAQLLSHSMDWLVTTDPHLHRYGDLGEIYLIPTVATHAAPLIAAWIRSRVRDPVLIGPDSESAQWVAAVARDAEAPFTVLSKVRHGDRDVEISVPDLDRWRDRTPVMVDDIISTGRTLMRAVSHLRECGTPPVTCVAVHGIFAGGAFEDLQAAGAATIVTCNTIPHPSNGIDVCGLLAGGVRQCLDQRETEP